MPKPRLVIFSEELPDCPCFKAVFNTEFDAESVCTLEQFLSKIKTSDPVIIQNRVFSDLRSNEHEEKCVSFAVKNPDF